MVVVGNILEKKLLVVVAFVALWIQKKRKT